MDEKADVSPLLAQDPADIASAPATVRRIGRRDWLKAAVGGGAGLAVGSLIDLPTVSAATKKLKLAEVSEFTTSCNFCSCGCGMVAAVRDGKLISM
jgi:formate dehydrogenase major subunit